MISKKLGAATEMEQHMLPMARNPAYIQFSGMPGIVCHEKQSHSVNRARSVYNLHPEHILQSIRCALAAHMHMHAQ